MITISQVTTEEVPQVKSLLSVVWQDTYGSIYPPGEIEKITAVWHAPERLLEQIKDPNVYFAAAKDEQSILVGLVMVRRLTKQNLFISRLYVHPAKQRQGIGKLLLARALEYFPDIKSVTLEVEEHNAKGKTFYLKHGFTQVGKKQIQFDNLSIPVLVLEKRF